MANETSPAPRRSLLGTGRGRMLRVSTVVVVLGAVGIWGTQWVQHRISHVVENDARITADMIAISSRVEGWVTEVAAGQGDRVRPDQLLVRIDSREARNKLAELEAQMDEAEAERATIEAELGMTEERIHHRVEAQHHKVQAGAAAVKAAEAQVVLRQSEHQRISALAGQRVVSAQRLEQVQADLSDAREALRSATAALAEAQSMLAEAVASRQEAAVLRGRLEQLVARRQRLVAQIDQARLDVSDRDITSPVRAVVDKIFIDAGEFVRPGQRLALIHNPEEIWVEANVRETDLRHVTVGALVNISVDAYPGAGFRGEVERLGTAVTSQFALLPNPNPSGNFTKVTQRVPVKIRIDQDAERPLRPGMMVEIEIVIPGRGGDAGS